MSPRRPLTYTASAEEPWDLFPEIQQREQAGWEIQSFWRTPRGWLRRSYVYYVRFMKRDPVPPPGQVSLALVMGPVNERDVPVAADALAVLTDTQKVTMTLRFKDKAGNPVSADQAQINGVPEWTSSSPDVLAVKSAADGLSAVILTTGKLGPAQVSAKASTTVNGVTADMSVVQNFDVRVGAATQIGADLGVPEERADGE
jgi:hypothetical protein